MTETSGARGAPGNPNATISARKLLALQNRRGAQEANFEELKSQTRMNYILRRRRAATQTWILAAIMAQNLNRELQRSSEQPERSATEQRCRRSIVRPGTRRIRLIQRASRLRNFFDFA